MRIQEQRKFEASEISAISSPVMRPERIGELDVGKIYETRAAIAGGKA